MSAPTSSSSSLTIPENFSALHLAWCAKPWTTTVPPSSTAKPPATTPSVKAPPRTVTPSTNKDTENPLLQARLWIKNSSSQLSNQPKLMKEYLKKLLVESKSQPNNEDADQKSNASLRHLEWQIVLLLELRVRCGDFVLAPFVRVHKKLSSNATNRKRRKRSLPAKTDAQVYQEYLQELFTRVAFLLPSSTPLGTFVCQHCLTPYMWKRIPKLVQHILDSFEIDNPYRTNQPRKEAPPPTAASRKPKSTQRRRKVPSGTRRLPLTDAKRNKTTKHFHSRLSDVKRLLHNTPAQTASLKRPAPAVTPSLPDGSSTSQSAKVEVLQTTSQPRSQAPKPMVRASSKGMEAPKKKKPEVVQASVHKSPVPRSSSVLTPTRTSHPKTPTPYGNSSSFLSPVPQSGDVIAETPQSKHSAAQSASETPCRVGETPCRPSSSRTQAYHVAETPRPPKEDSLVFSPGLLTPSFHDDNKQKNTKPLSLFRTISQSKLPPPPLPISQDRTTLPPRPTTAAVEAARSFLRRKSL